MVRSGYSGLMRSNSSFILRPREREEVARGWKGIADPARSDLCPPRHELDGVSHSKITYEIYQYIVETINARFEE